MKIAKTIKDDFPWFRNNRGWTYLDSGATSLKPQSVINSIFDYYSKWSSNPHNADSLLTYHSLEMIDQVRGKLAKLLNASKEELVFTSGATESICLVANGLKPIIKSGDEIILTDGEHTSNLLPWMELAETTHAKLIYAKNNSIGIPTEDSIIKAITSKTKIIALADVSNLLGYELDVTKIEKAAHKINKNIIIVVDATQSFPHRPLDLKRTNVDFLACSGHKMLAGTGIGLCYIKHKFLNWLKPIRLGGGMNNNVTCNSFTFASSPDKYEGGSPHTAGIVSWGAAIDYLNAYGWKKIRQHDIELKQYLNKEFAKLPNVNYYNGYAKYPIAIFNIKGIHSHDFANYLGHKKIIVRSGLSCAKLAKNMINQDGVVRASFYIYNDKHDVDVLIKAIKEFKKGDELKYVI